MDVGRRGGAGRNRIAAGSVWESRMKMDEIKGGIKVCNGEENHPDKNDESNQNINNSPASGLQLYRRSRPNHGLIGATGKRKTWKSEITERSIQIARQRSDSSKNLEEQAKELSVSADGIKRNPVPIKARSEVGKELSLSCDSIARSPIGKMKGKSVPMKGSIDSSNGIEKNSIPIRNSKSESVQSLDEGIERNGELRKVKSTLVQPEKAKSVSSEVSDENSGGIGTNGELKKVKSTLVQPEKAKSVSSEVSDETSGGIERNGELRKVNSASVKLARAESVSNEVLDESSGGIERNSAELRKPNSEPVVDNSNKGIENNPAEIGKQEPDEDGEEFDVCEEKVITSSFTSVGRAKCSPESMAIDDNEDGLDGDEADWDDDEMEEQIDEDIEIEIEKKTLDVKEINVSEPEPKPEPEPEQGPRKVLVEVRKFNQRNEKAVPVSQIVEKPPSPSVKAHPNYETSVPRSPIVKKQPSPTVNHQRSYPSVARNIPTPVSNEYRRNPRTHNKLQSLVDLVMWREVSRSAFVFGVGTFVIVSSSYTKDLNISLISVLSYLGLVYLAAVFFFRSIIYRGGHYLDDTMVDSVVGEEDAVWLLKLILPYLNEFLVKLKTLFSGDPATTMKLAVMLFVLARCGSSITIWKLAKFGFFGVFTLPKICSSYSTQLSAYGIFWVRRFRDAWDSCSHKKAVAFAIFTLVWNLSSIVARIWAVFMLVVAFRYYQQSLIIEEEEEGEEGGDWMEEEGGGRGSSSKDSRWQGQIGRQRPPGRSVPPPTLNHIKKQKKVS